MSARSLCALLAVASVASAHATPAVEAPHYQLTLSRLQTDGPDRYSAEASSVAGEATFPLGESMGLSLRGTWRRTEADQGAGTSSELESTAVGAGLFARDPQSGLVGLSYQQVDSEGRSSTDGFGDVSLDGNATVEAIFAESYSGQSTLRLTRERYRYDQGDEEDDFATVQLKGYATANWSFGITAGLLDAKDSYTYATELQPQVFGNAASIGLSYQTAEDAETYLLFFSFFFGDHAQLIDRDRRLR